MRGNLDQDRRQTGRSARRVRRGLLTLAILPLILGCLVFFPRLQRSLIYVPYRGPVPVSAARLPAERIAEVQVAVTDRITLEGWKTRPAGTPWGAARGLVILFPGNAGHRAFRAPIMQDFNKLGWECLIFDYRGYAGNKGRPSEENLARDARKIWDFARDELGYPASQIVLCGESLGGGVAVRLAWDLAREGVSPAGLILRTTFTSLADTAQYLYPFFPVRWFVVDRYPSLQRIGDITCPILSIHGELDRIVPYDQGRKLFEAAPATSASGIPKMFLRLPETGHNDLMLTAAAELHETHRSFLEQLQPAAVTAQEPQ